MHRQIIASSFALSMLLVLTAPLAASDGVIEINQAKAIAGGVSAGDAPGFPVTIDTPGSYLLTGELSVTDADTTVIAIESSDVTLDLNGFTVRGPNSCFHGSSQIQCSVTGIGYGIWVAASYRSIVIRNGTVSGAPYSGIQCGECRLENLSIDSCGNHGIEANNSFIEGCIAKYTQNNGFLLVNSTVKDSSAEYNGISGFTLSEGTVATGIRSAWNIGSGI